MRFLVFSIAFMTFFATGCSSTSYSTSDKVDGLKKNSVKKRETVPLSRRK